MNQKQFANINNFQCQERSRREDSLKEEVNTAGLESPSPGRVPPLPFSALVGGGGVWSSINKAENSYAHFYAVHRRGSAFPSLPPAFLWFLALPSPEAPRRHRVSSAHLGARGFLPKGCSFLCPQPTAAQSLKEWRNTIMCGLLVLKALHGKGMRTTMAVWSLL